jgi:hypothetical protein
MDFSTLFYRLPKDFALEGLVGEDRDGMLLEIAKTIYKQFLLDVYDAIGEEKFSALVASIGMGEEFYATTLKHLLPGYREVFLTSRMKILDAFHKEQE